MSSRTDTLSVHTDYMRRAHNPREVIDAFRLLRKHHPKRLQFDTLVGTGLSGAIIVPPLARALRKHYLIVRKSNDGTHSSYPAEGVLGRRWLFVDDLIASGATLRRVLGVVQSLHEYRYSVGFSTEMVGMFLYGDGYSSRDASLKETHAFEQVDCFGNDVWEWNNLTTVTERKLREQLCTGCEEGCAGAGCKGPSCDHCWTWCEKTCSYYQLRDPAYNYPSKLVVTYN